MERGVTFKATAGLHHPLRGDYRLTYDEKAQQGRMYGYLNVFLAAALLSIGASETDAIAMLEETNAANLEFNDLQAGWRGPHRSYVLDRVVLALVRSNVITSFGSCSFTEPVDEARAMGIT
jgi:hypothetical protein